MAAQVTVETEDFSHSDGQSSGEDSRLSSPPREDGTEEVASPPQGGLASVMAGILGKKKLPKKVVILAKGKTDRQIALKKRRKEEEEAEANKKKPESGDAKETETENELQKRLKKKEWNEFGRVKPSVLDRELERKLQRIATRGVVQLFNAVRKQQKDIDDKLNEVGSSVRKREKVMKSVSKGAFLDMLKGTGTKSSSKDSKETRMDVETNEQTQDDDEGEKNKPSWSILRDDFMMGATMKDWDKVSDGDSDNESEDPDEDNLDSEDDEVS